MSTQSVPCISSPEPMFLLDLAPGLEVEYLETDSLIQYVSDKRDNTPDLVNDLTFVEFDLSDLVSSNCVDRAEVIDKSDHGYACKAPSAAEVCVQPEHLYALAPDIETR